MTTEQTQVNKSSKNPFKNCAVVPKLSELTVPNAIVCIEKSLEKWNLNDDERRIDQITIIIIDTSDLEIYRWEGHHKKYDEMDELKKICSEKEVEIQKIILTVFHKKYGVIMVTPFIMYQKI